MIRGTVMILAEAGRASAAPWSNHLTLLLSFILFMLSFFLLAEAIKTLRWRIPEAPHADSGALLSVITACIILSVWILRVMVVTRVAPDKDFLMDFLFVRSRELAPGFLLAGLAPICVAVFKLLTVVAAGPRHVEGWESAQRPLLVVWIQTAFVLLVAVASVVMLIRTLQ
jgi:hypothetical protein